MPASLASDPQTLLADLLRTQCGLVAIDALIAAAYLDSAIEALCHEHRLERIRAETD